MSTYELKVSKEMRATAERVYAVLADYQDGHPHILPKKYFTHLEVIEGGQGAGTIFKATLEVMGAKQELQMEVREPEPGRVLEEEDAQAGILTRFIVEPSTNPERAYLTIQTVWQEKKGIKGFFEKLFNPLIVKKIYQEELELINDFCSKG